MDRHPVALRNYNTSSLRMAFGEEEGNGEDACAESQVPSFMKKPEIIKMHLEILYKSVMFLSEEKIAAKIELYKQAKEQKKRDHDARLQMQNQMKKQRGRSANQQQANYHHMNKKDRKMQVSGDREGA